MKIASEAIRNSDVRRKMFGILLKVYFLTECYFGVKLILRIRTTRGSVIIVR